MKLQMNDFGKEGMLMSKQLSKRLLRLTAVLVLLEVLTFPIVVKLTFAGRSEGTDRILTYSPGKLVWDDDKKILSDGTAVLSLFDSDYTNVKADNGDLLIAPGTGGESIVRLKNEAGYTVEYTAICYSIESPKLSGMTVTLESEGATEIEPGNELKDIPESKIIRALSGTVAAGQIQDFDVGFEWNYEINHAIDEDDTDLGDASAIGKSDDITIGIIVYITDMNYGGGDIGPATGDHIPFTLYIILTIVSAVFLIFLIIERRRNEEREAVD